MKPPVIVNETPPVVVVIEQPPIVVPVIPVYKSGRPA